MSMDFRKPDEQGGSKNQWMKKTHEALDDVEELRVDIPKEMNRTDPFGVPAEVDFYNRLVQRFVRRIRPKRGALGARMVTEEGRDPETCLWTQKVATVPIPKDGKTVHVGEANIHGEIDVAEAFQKVEWESKAVRLSNLEWWNEKQVSLTAQFLTDGEGYQERTIRKSIYLPVYALDAVVNQANECLEDLGWTPDEEEKELNSEPLSPGGIDR